MDTELWKYKNNLGHQIYYQYLVVVEHMIALLSISPKLTMLDTLKLEHITEDRELLFHNFSTPLPPNPPIHLMQMLNDERTTPS